MLTTKIQCLIHLQNALYFRTTCIFSWLMLATEFCPEFQKYCDSMMKELCFITASRHRTKSNVIYVLTPEIFGRGIEVLVNDNCEHVQSTMLYELISYSVWLLSWSINIIPFDSRVSIRSIWALNVWMKCLHLSPYISGWVKWSISYGGPYIKSIFSISISRISVVSCVEESVKMRLKKNKRTTLTTCQTSKAPDAPVTKRFDVERLFCISRTSFSMWWYQ